MPLAGENLRATDRRRVGTTINTTGSGTFTTTETTVESVTFSAIAGVQYEILYAAALWKSSVSADVVSVRCREDSSTGTQLIGIDFDAVIANHYYSPVVRALWTASSTVSKTIVITGQRKSGTGNISRDAGATNPAITTVTSVS